MKQTDFHTLPVELQEEIKDILRVYDSVPVFYENGTYHFSSVIKKSYAPDHQFIGVYHASDIFDERERMLNYINEFQDYPVAYHGKRDYRIFRTKSRRVFKWDGDDLVPVC